MAICSGFMASRGEPSDSLDDFPTPPWAGRALIEHVLGDCWRNCTVWEPAANRGFLLRGLKDYFQAWYASDVCDYGAGFDVSDYLVDRAPQPVDFIITNPPFNLAHAFIDKALKESTVGCAFLVRTAFLEGVNRYHSLWSRTPPAYVAQFVERVPMVKGRCDPEASTATNYCWVVWHHHRPAVDTLMKWIPPCRMRLERPGDYDLPEGVINAPR
jgi:hypothetical protein